MTASIEEIPVTVLSGFLGSGKSTLLNAMLRNPAMPPTAVIINEFGEIAIDHALVEGVVEGVTLLGSGCVCCAVRSDLEAALRDLHLKRVRGSIPAFSGVILETTGLASPAPVLQTLTSRPVRELRYRLASLVTTVDVVHGAETMQRYREASQQVAMADRIVLTKSDLVPSSDQICADIRALNPRAEILVAPRGQIAPGRVLETPDATLANVWENRRTSSVHDAHSHGIVSASRRFAGQFDWDRLDAVLRAFLSEHGERLLRLKGIVRLVGIDRPVAVHAVHHSLYPLAFVDGAAALATCSMVVIGDLLPRESIDTLWQRIASAVADPVEEVAAGPARS